MSELVVTSALLAGILLAVQAAANVQLTKALGHAFAAATLQLTVGASALAGIAVVTNALPATAEIVRAAPWHLLGGLGSALFVTAGIVLVPRLGATGALGLFIAGQLAASAAIDHLGLLGVHRRPFSPAEIAGLAAVVLGTFVIVRALPPANGRFSAGSVALGLAAGAALPLQGAVNAQLRVDLGAPLAVSLVSFTVAALAMLLLTLGSRTRLPRPNLSRAALVSIPWWGWLGGIMGAAYVTTVFTAIPVIGAAAVVGLTIAGQQMAAVAADQFAWLRLPRRRVTAARLGGVLSLVSGAILVQIVH